MANNLMQTAAAISDYAIIVNQGDNVAVVKNETFENLVVLLPNQKTTVTLKQAVPPGHRFATQIIPAGDFVRQYNQPISTSLGIDAGDLDHARKYVK